MATGRWGDHDGVRVELTITDDGTRQNGDAARVVIRDVSGKVLADTGDRTVRNGGMTVRAA